MDKSVKPHFSELVTTLDPKQLLSKLYYSACRNQLPVALWSLPDSEEIHLVISFEKPMKLERPELEDLPGGFIVTPFQDDESSFIKGDVLFKTSEQSIRVNPVSNITSGGEDFVKSISNDLKESSRGHYPRASANGNVDDRDRFLQIVERAVKEISNGSFEKVVPSRRIQIPIGEDFDPVAMFEFLTSEYPGALTSLVSIPDVGTWIGASPELLISVDTDQIFRTVSLAGTQPWENQRLADVAWTQKEIEEQALVCRYIINCFKKIRLREFEEHGPRTSLAGNLLHLKTTYEVDMKATNFPQLGSVMLNLLHPTSAVCGMPKDAAIEFLGENEGFNRSFFSGYLGPVNISGETHIFVNLRCMELLENSAYLYAGAGVTEDSIPEKEWEETELKLTTLSKHIQ